MLSFNTHIRDRPLAATDGSIGAVSDLYFDDHTRAVRWLVVDTGTWLPGCKVLLPASRVGPPDARRAALQVDATREQVKNAPGLEANEPVSRRMEQSVYGYYNWAPYWGAPTLIPGGTIPNAPPGIVPAGAGAGPQADRPGEPGSQPEHGDPHLRSADTVTGYYVAASDGELGHVEDFLVDAGRWRIDALVVDTRNWWPGRKVVLPADRLVGISWGERTVTIAQTRDEILNAPDYQPRQPAAALRGAG